MNYFILTLTLLTLTGFNVSADINIDPQTYHAQRALEKKQRLEKQTATALEEKSSSKIKTAPSEKHTLTAHTPVKENDTTTLNVLTNSELQTTSDVKN